MSSPEFILESRSDSFRNADRLDTEMCPSLDSGSEKDATKGARTSERGRRAMEYMTATLICWPAQMAGE
jgi:hypothetical protein